MCPYFGNLKFSHSFYWLMSTVLITRRSWVRSPIGHILFYFIIKLNIFFEDNKKFQSLMVQAFNVLFRKKKENWNIFPNVPDRWSAGYRELDKTRASLKTFLTFPTENSTFVQVEKIVSGDGLPSSFSILRLRPTKGPWRKKDVFATCLLRNV